MLVSHWEILESSYLIHCKGVFKKLRFERELLIRYLHRIRLKFTPREQKQLLHYIFSNVSQTHTYIYKHIYIKKIYF